MNFKELLSIIVNITGKDSSDELKSEFYKNFINHFPGSDIKIYEIMKIREDNKESQNNEYIAIDTLTNKPDPIKLNGRKMFLKCIETKKIIKGKKSSKNLYITLYPILENNKTTHILLIETINKTIEDKMIIDKIIEIFNNQLSLINNKDKDYLTGLYNRHAYNRSIHSLFAMGNLIDCTMDRCYCTFLSMMDIDRFKLINDNYGHLVGDEILILFSQILKSSFRHGDPIFRYGGEEFIVLLHNTDINETEISIERFRAKIESYKFPQVGRVTASIGYVCINKGDNPFTIVDKADKALYYAKEHGRNSIFSYEELVSEGKIKPLEVKPSIIEIW